MPPQIKQVNIDIEKAYPEAYRLARKFHDLYEEIAPQFGYETRGDTKAFEPASPNGRTMAYVCKEIVDEEIKQAKLETLEAIIKEVEGMRKVVGVKDCRHYPDKGTDLLADQYNRALSDLLTTLQAELTLLKNER